jgi:glyoxylase-like metal-dependent hydrolase (beta-lactamase superfamily II)
MIDTANTPEQGRLLTNWWRGRGGHIRLAVATHFHSDRTGGIDGLRAIGVATLAHPATCTLARAHGMPVPEPAVFTDQVWRIDDAIEMFAPGPGHTRDNVVVWLAGPRILFGGCMLKSVTAPDLGYVADAAVRDWPRSLQRVRARYAGARMVVPGHGTVHGDAMGATERLLGGARGI